MNSLAEFDDAFERLPPAAFTAEMFRALPAPWLSNGFYTLTFPSGEHRTFRVRLDRDGIHSGKRTLAALIGPDNSGDYETRGVVGANGFELFRRFRSGKPLEHASLLWRLARGEQIDGYELLVSKRCRLCNRPLTEPDSLSSELGPTCRKVVGL